MSNRICIAGVFALLLMTAPARASTLTVENIDLNFGGDQLAGDIGIFQTYKGWILNPSLTFNGTPISSCCGVPFTNPPSANLVTPDSGVIGLYVAIANLPNLTFADFAIGAPYSQPLTVATSGTVTCVSGCDVSAVPLPAALPLFGTALVGLGGAGWLRRRKVSSKV